MVRPPEYLVNPGISQSDITLFEKNIVKFHKKVILKEEVEDQKSDAMDQGAIADNILLNPENNKNYYVLTDFKASGKEKDIVDIVARMIKTKIEGDIANKKAHENALIMKNWPELKNFEKEIIMAADSIDWQPKWKLETKVEKIKENGKDYFEQLKEAAGKEIVKMDVWNAAHSILDQIKEDESTSGVFKMLRGELNEKQKARYIVHKAAALFGIDPVTAQAIKGLLDFFIEDTKLKLIHPWDLKTAKSLAQFLNNYRISRYGRQGAVYTTLLKLNFKDYKVLPFKFLVIPTKSEEPPEVFTMSESELIANMDGAESPLGYRIKGFRELITEIQWHTENSKWMHRKEYYMTGHNLIKGNMNVDPSLLVDSDEVIF